MVQITLWHPGGEGQHHTSSGRHLVLTIHVSYTGEMRSGANSSGWVSVQIMLCHPDDMILNCRSISHRDEIRSGAKSSKWPKVQISSSHPDGIGQRRYSSGWHPHHGRHNERDGVLNHRRLDCLLHGKHQSSASPAFVRGIRQWLVNSKHKGPVTRKLFPFDDEISRITWWRLQMETFSALLAFCAGNSSAVGEFFAQRPVTRNFDVFFNDSWANNGDAGNLRRYRAHCFVSVMIWFITRPCFVI